MAEHRTKGGYESGTMSASQLLTGFPEVLKRPGADCLAPTEPQDTPPKVPILPCPKCGEPDTTIHWCEGGYSIVLGHCGESADHFHRGCDRCGHRWKTFDVLDSGTTPAP